jgi:hypothetical protein
MFFACQSGQPLHSLGGASLKKQKTESKKTLVPRGGDMNTPARLNAFAAFLSFGFVIAVALGMF